MMDSFFSSFTGTPLNGILLAFLFLLSCRGTGAFLLEKISCRSNGFALPASLGMNLAAWSLVLLSFLKVPLLSQGFFLLFLCFGFVANLKYRSFGRFYVIPLIGTCFLLGNALAVPSGWDECVYQLTVPMRWAMQGNWNVFPDLPYSGFPLLPQFIYRELIVCSGLCSAKAFSILILCTCSWALCEHFNSRRWTAELISLIFLLSPVTSVLAGGTYAEAFIALDFLCAVQLLKRDSKEKTCFLCGFLLSGPAAAVKLTGCFIAAALLIYGLLRKYFHWKTVILFILGSAVFVFPFYLRPLLETANPFWPYLGAWFSGNQNIVEMSAFHHAIGKSYFGTDSGWGFVLTPFLLAFQSEKGLFDGFFGLPLFVIYPILFYFLFSRRKRVRKWLPGLVTGVFLYGVWYFTSPQTRFLLPLYLLLLSGVYYVLQTFPEKRRLFLIILMTVLALYSLKDEVFWRNTLIRFERWNDPVNLFYSETNDDLLLLIDHLQRSPEKRTLLLFEERTLFLRNAVIATPFFQSEYFTPPDSVTPEKLLAEMKRANASQLYFRIPENNPDLSREHLERCARFFESLRNLEMKRIPIGKTGFILSAE